MGGAGGGQGSGVRGRTEDKGGKGNNGACRLRIGQWNIGTLTESRNADEYKLWYSGVLKGKNGVGILVDRELRESAVVVRRVNDRLTSIKLLVGEYTINVVSAYAPQAGLDEENKRRFWEGMDEIVRSIPPAKRLFIGGDFNGHIGTTAGGYGEVHGGFSFGDRNAGGTSL
ncbi:PREDICTED: craniofacial development protein 2-like [Nicotiana attenuata]|uniref:craniofacial development protein 2-like n=1 Tax=Nicotiana attenuata TaxID=49451 RepID=UPI0009058F6F|nr:PREDICTED: craniofacial development protein 2-like [Nicotiana attenuata]